MWLGVIGIFYGAWMAFSQYDIKRLIAYTSVSHMGFVLIAIYTGSQLAYQGAVIQMIAHGLSAAGLFILAVSCTNVCIPAICVRWAVCGAKLNGCRRCRCSSRSRPSGCRAPVTSSANL
jgi:hypothetical protein